MTAVAETYSKVTVRAATREERHEMWMNFLNVLALGSVVEAADTIVWQKKAKFMWQMVGSATEYSTDSIAWPVHQLRAGVE